MAKDWGLDDGVSQVMRLRQTRPSGNKEEEEEEEKRVKSPEQGWRFDNRRRAGSP